MRRGFTIIELAVSIVIMSIVAIGILMALKSGKANYNRAMETAFSRKFELGLKESFEAILNTLEPICGAIGSDAQVDWGWGHPSCQNSSPFPQYFAKNEISYTLDFASIPNAQASKMKNAIIGAYAPFCREDTANSNNARLVIVCPHIKSLNYDTVGGNVNNPKPAGGGYINQTDIPTVNFTYERHYMSGVTEDIAYSFSMNDVYAKRIGYSLDKFSDIKNALKDYYEKRLTIELVNTPPRGLHSVDDEYVPWFWLVFGDNADPYSYPVCDRNGGDTCQNLNTNGYWRSGNGIARALIMRRLVANIMNGESRYTVDGFMNKVMLYPIISECGGSDLDACAIDAPPIPQKDYYNMADIPYSSVLYTGNSNDLTVARPEFTRLEIVY